MLTILAILIATTSRSAPSATPTFESFSVPKQRPFIAVKPDVRRGRAHLYRTVLRQAAKEPPDFAGHFKIVRWGCGTCCSEFAILDLMTGHAFFPGFVVACEHPMDFTRPGIAFDYRIDSRLLVISGAPNESNGGIRYFEWNGVSMKLLKVAKSAAASNKAAAPDAVPFAAAFLVSSSVSLLPREARRG